MSHISVLHNMMVRNDCMISQRCMPRAYYGASVAGGAPVTPGTGPGSDFLPLLRANLTKLVATNSLQAFYPPQRIEEVLARLVQVDFR